MPSSSAITGRGPAVVPYKGELPPASLLRLFFLPDIHQGPRSWVGRGAAAEGPASVVLGHSGTGDITNSQCGWAMECGLIHGVMWACGLKNVQIQDKEEGHGG